jgi:hypothetical protein
VLKGEPRQTVKKGVCIGGFCRGRKAIQIQYVHPFTKENICSVCYKNIRRLQERARLILQGESWEVLLPSPRIAKGV